MVIRMNLSQKTYREAENVAHRNATDCGSSSTTALLDFREANHPVWLDLHALVIWIWSSHLCSITWTNHFELCSNRHMLQWTAHAQEISRQACRKHDPTSLVYSMSVHHTKIRSLIHFIRTVIRRRWCSELHSLYESSGRNGHVFALHIRSSRNAEVLTRSLVGRRMLCNSQRFMKLVKAHRALSVWP